MSKFVEDVVGIHMENEGVAGNEYSLKHTTGRKQYSTLTFRRGKPLPSNLLAVLRCTFTVDEEFYDDDDGEDDEGKPIIRRSWSYTISAKV